MPTERRLFQASLPLLSLRSRSPPPRRLIFQAISEKQRVWGRRLPWIPLALSVSLSEPVVLTTCRFSALTDLRLWTSVRAYNWSQAGDALLSEHIVSSIVSETLATSRSGLAIVLTIATKPVVWLEPSLVSQRNANKARRLELIHTISWVQETSCT